MMKELKDPDDRNLEMTLLNFLVGNMDVVGVRGELAWPPFKRLALLGGTTVDGQVPFVAEHPKKPGVYAYGWCDATAIRFGRCNHNKQTKAEATKMPPAPTTNSGDPEAGRKIFVYTCIGIILVVSAATSVSAYKLYKANRNGVTTG